MPDSQFGDFRIYPRGFLGAKMDPILERKNNPSSSSRLQYNIALFDSDDAKRVIVNMDIERLYTAMARNDLTTSKRFDFREEALSHILWAFGTKNFEEWYKMQYQSPSFGVMHSDFLEDCLRFVDTGKRHLSIVSWDTILGAADTKVYGSNLPEKASTFFNRTTIDQLNTGDQSRNAKLTEVIQEWMRQPTGFSDLLTTAHILFGITL